MDHLSTPNNPFFPKPVVRFLGQRYDGEYFLGYPYRCRITELSILRPESAEKVVKLAPFLQAWLFFGLLHLVFNDSGENFIQVEHDKNGKTGRMIITTSALDQLRDERLQDVLWLKKEKPKKYMDYVEFCQKCFFEANYILTSITPSTFRELTAEVFTSLHMLLQYSTNTLCFVNNFQFINRITLNITPACNLLTERMRERGWCPTLIQIFKRVGDIDGLYYVSNMDLFVPDNHDNCTEIRCANNQIDKNHYTPLHVADRCLNPRNCNFEEAHHTELMSILETGSIPLIMSKKSSRRKLAIQLVKFEKGMRYVAISHVWSQGKGNPMSNSLPQCQLSYISEKVNGLYPNEDEIAFWIDTICCPIKPTRAQAMALERIAATYENADKVLVLDSTLESALLPGDGMQKDIIEDCLLRIFAAPWMRRMWTFQEGLLAKRLYFQFLDGALDFWGAQSQVRVDYLKPAIEEKLSKGRLRHREASFAIWKMTGIYRYILFLEQNLLTVQIRSRPVLESISLPLQFRSASVAEDEALCVGTLLRLDMRRIISKPAKERMVEVWNLLGERGDLRQSMLFHKGPKLDTDRFRWAPRTLLGMNGIAFSGSGPAAKLSKKGLLFDCPGFVLHYCGYRLANRFNFKSFGNCMYWCSIQKPTSEFNCNNDGRNEFVMKRKASVLSEKFLAVLVDTSHFDIPESGLEHCSYPKMDICTTTFDENIFQEISSTRGALVSIEGVKGEVCYVRLLGNVTITKAKDVSVRMDENLGTLFDDRLHSWLAEDRNNITSWHDRVKGLASQAYLPNICARYFEKETWCCY